MKQVVLRIEDSAFKDFKAFLRLCPSIEMVNEYSDLEVRKNMDICIEEAIRELRKGKVFRKPSDYTYVMQVINDRQVKDAPYFIRQMYFLDIWNSLALTDYQAVQRYTIQEK